VGERKEKGKKGDKGAFSAGRFGVNLEKQIMIEESLCGIFVTKK